MMGVVKSDEEFEQLLCMLTLCCPLECKIYLSYRDFSGRITSSPDVYPHIIWSICPQAGQEIDW